MYVHGNPIRYKDPTGHKVIDSCGKGGSPGKCNIDPKTRALLNELDKKTKNVDYKIIGGVRSKKRNKEVGGSKTSRHMKKFGGDAIDVNPVIKKGSKLTSEDLAKKAKEVGFGGVILYKHETGASKNPKGGKLHLDRRKKEYNAEKIPNPNKKSKKKSIYIKRDFSAELNKI